MNSRRRGYVLLEVMAAAAVIALVATALFAAMAGALQIFGAARAVSRGRLLAAAHIELAAAGLAGPSLTEGGLTSVLTVLTAEGCTLWQAEVQGPGLAQPLRLVGGP